MGTTNKWRHIGVFLKEMRTKRGVTQADLAKELGYSTSQFVSNWERGLCAPPLDSLVRISEFLNISKNVIVNLIVEQTKFEIEKRFSKARSSKRSS